MKVLAISLIVAVALATTAVVPASAQRRGGNNSRPAGSFGGGQQHQQGQIQRPCPPPPQRRDDDHRDRGRWHEPITLGSVLRNVAVIGVAAWALSSAPAPCYAAPAMSYQSASPACVADTQYGSQVIINRGARHGVTVGMRFAVMGRWITDPNTGQPLTRIAKAEIVVLQADALASICKIEGESREGVCRGDEIVPATAPTY